MKCNVYTSWLLSVLVIFSVAINSCRKSKPGFQNTPLTFDVPEGFPAPVYDFTLNPITLEGFSLGKKLFHDSRLSKNQDVTCGSCHQQFAAFTTFDHDLGHGTNNQHTTRNVPSIFNMVWHDEFGWDGRTKSLDEQVLACITAPERMGETMEEVIARIDTSLEYANLIADAFGDGKANEERISKALTQFVAMIVSANSKYDHVKSGNAEFNPNEAAGYELFQSNCASCHAEPLFTDLSYRNIGLPHRDFHADAGRMLVTGNNNDSLKFKVPSLRNIAITSYYAHDGRFAGVTEVLDHYTSGIVYGSTLDPDLKNGLKLTNLEKFYIMEFLTTLTDSSLVNDPQFR